MNRFCCSLATMCIQFSVDMEFFLSFARNTIEVASGNTGENTTTAKSTHQYKNNWISFAALVHCM